MRLDRREFVRGAAAALAWLAAPRAAGAARDPTLEIHDATRNTRLRALGVRLWGRGSAPQRFKTYPGLEPVPLPAPDITDARALHDAAASWTPPSGFRAASVDLATLGRLLQHTNGVTGDMMGFRLRAAPSAGALYAGEVYLVAERVEGLAPGVYYYAVRSHGLVPLASGSFAARVSACVERPAAIRDAAAFVLLSNVFHRYVQRYRSRGYRYALIDTGHIGENLRLAAASAGLATLAPTRFHDEALDALLSLDGRDESTCALHAVGAARPTAGAAPVERALAEKGRDPGVKRRRSPPERYHDSTRLVPAEGAPAAVGWPASSEPASGGETIVLPARPPPPTTVERAIAVRRSAAAFVEVPMTLADLGFVLRVARGNASLARSPGVELYLVVHRAIDLASGVYRLGPGADSLVRVAAGDFREPLRDACLGQGRAATAAVAVALVGRLAAASAAGARSYRDLLIESGAVAQRVYLAAESLGLAARNLAAYVDDDFNDLLGLDGRERAVLHLTMLGPGD